MTSFLDAVILSEAGRTTTGAVEGSAVAFRTASSHSLRVFTIACLALAIFASPPAFAQSAPRVIAITGGRLLTVSHGTIDNGVLVMANGNITAVGESGKVQCPTRCRRSWMRRA